jgi:Fasciclin domain
MKLIVILSFLAAKVLAFTVSPITPPKPLRRESTELCIGLGGGYDNSIWSTLSTLEGPSICYGPQGILIGKEELEIKEYDNFDMFCDALQQTGLAKLLRDTRGPKYTVLAPVNSGILSYTDYLDIEILKYHIIKGDIYSDEFTGPLETLNGASILGRVEFRKVLADDAFIGQKDNHTYGTKYPTDIICDNGVIHAIKHVLTPGYTTPSNPWTGNDTASTPWASGQKA